MTLCHSFHTFGMKCATGVQLAALDFKTEHVSFKINQLTIHCPPKSPFIFLNDYVKNQPISIIFGTRKS